MTFQEFLVALRNARRRKGVSVFLGGDLEVRAWHARECRHCYCPITLVCAVMGGGVFEVDEYCEAGQKIGLSEKLAYLIVQSADGNLELHQKTEQRKRRAMLRALGLVRAERRRLAEKKKEKMRTAF